jgi:DNA-binding MarR family transcriptional regulator
MNQGKIQGYAKQLERLLPSLIKASKKLEEKRLGTYSLTLPQFFAMMVLENNGSCMMKELGEELGLSLGTVTGIVDRLIREGLAERFPDAEDRRVVRARLSEKGRKLMRTIHEERRRALARRLQNLGENELENLMTLITKISQLFE